MQSEVRQVDRLFLFSKLFAEFQEDTVSILCAVTDTVNKFLCLLKGNSAQFRRFRDSLRFRIKKTLVKDTMEFPSQKIEYIFVKSNFIHKQKLGLCLSKIFPA